MVSRGFDGHGPPLPPLPCALLERRRGRSDGRGREGSVREQKQNPEETERAHKTCGTNDGLQPETRH
jgi:hypothetical protein